MFRTPRRVGFFYVSDSKDESTNWTLLYSYQQGNTLFSFYVDDKGKLRGISERDDAQHVALIIKGMPVEWQSDLLILEKQEAVKQMLSQCFFTNTGFEIEINPRGLGGWLKEVHHHRTHEWCRDILKFSEDDSQLIANSCNGVDSGGTDPVMGFFSKGAQGWHFNTHGKQDGVIDDSRIRHAVANLQLAIDIKNSHDRVFVYKRHGLQFKIEMKGGDVDHDARWLAMKHRLVLFVLGEGLHPLQDIFAHTKMFVHSVMKRKGRFHNFNLLSGADIPKHIDNKKRSPLSLDSMDASAGYSQRFTNTRLLTCFYLRCYNENRKLSREELSRYVTAALEIARYQEKGRGVTNGKERLVALQRELGFSDVSTAMPTAVSHTPGGGSASRADSAISGFKFMDVATYNAVLATKLGMAVAGSDGEVAGVSGDADDSDTEFFDPL